MTYSALHEHASKLAALTAPDNRRDNTLLWGLAVTAEWRAIVRGWVEMTTVGMEKETQTMFTITPITQDQVNSLEAKLAVSGTLINVPDPKVPNTYGIYNKEHGIQATAVYDATGEGSLAVTVTRKPFLVPESAIKSGIEEALQS